MVSFPPTRKTHHTEYETRTLLLLLTREIFAASHCTPTVNTRTPNIGGFRRGSLSNVGPWQHPACQFILNIGAFRTENLRPRRSVCHQVRLGCLKSVGVIRGKETSHPDPQPTVCVCGVCQFPFGGGLSRTQSVSQWSGRPSKKEQRSESCLVRQQLKRGDIFSQLVTAVTDPVEESQRTKNYVGSKFFPGGVKAVGN